MEDEAIRTLEMIEQAVAKSTAQYGALKKRAEDIYQGRVDYLAKQNGCSQSEAHALAANDEVASRAYRASTELAEKHAAAINAAGQIASVIE